MFDPRRRCLFLRTGFGLRNELYNNNNHLGLGLWGLVSGFCWARLQWQRQWQRQRQRQQQQQGRALLIYHGTTTTTTTSGRIFGIVATPGTLSRLTDDATSDMA
ncbi:hypothetical protein ACLKA7_015855 [Drosophila subpalustris]